MCRANVVLFVIFLKLPLLTELYIFNSVSYRFDTDFFRPHGYILDKDTDMIISPTRDVKWMKPDENFFDQKLFNMIKNKTKSVAWIASNCNSRNSRMMFAEFLSKNSTKVDRYGGCGMPG
jgi:hypothetical protein